jgi:hypothetical protein
MKRKKIFLIASIIGIIAIVAINVKLNSIKDTCSLFLLDNIVALSDGGESGNSTCQWELKNECSSTYEGWGTYQGILRKGIFITTTVTCVGTGGTICCTPSSTTTFTPNSSS